MSIRYQRQTRRAALLVAAALLALGGGTAVAGVSTSPDAALRNDIAHFPAREGGPLSTRSATPAKASPQAVVVRVDGGFDWPAAGVGAAAVLGFLLVAGGAASALRPRKKVA